MNNKEQLLKDSNIIKELAKERDELTYNSVSKETWLIFFISCIAVWISSLIGGILLIIIAIILVLFIINEIVEIKSKSNRSSYIAMEELKARPKILASLLVILIIGVIVNIYIANSSQLFNAMGYGLVTITLIALIILSKWLYTRYGKLANIDDLIHEMLVKVHKTDFFNDITRDLNERFKDTQVSIDEHSIRPASAYVDGVRLRIDCFAIYSIEPDDNHSEMIDLIMANLKELNKLHKQMMNSVEINSDSMKIVYDSNCIYVYIKNKEPRFNEYGNAIYSGTRFRLADLNKIDKDNPDKADLKALEVKDAMY